MAAPQTSRQKIVTDLIAWSAVAAAAQNIGNELDCRDKLWAMIGIFFGLDSASTPVGTEILIQKSDKDSGNDSWITIDRIITGTTAPATIANDGSQAAGTGADGSPILCGATVPALGDMMLFKNAILSLSEIGIVVARVTTGGSESYTLRDALTNAQASGNYYTKAEKYSRLYNLAGIRRLRPAVNNNYAASPASCVVRVSCVAEYGYPV